MLKTDATLCLPLPIALKDVHEQHMSMRRQAPDMIWDADVSTGSAAKPGGGGGSKSTRAQRGNGGTVAAKRVKLLKRASNACASLDWTRDRALLYRAV